MTDATILDAQLAAAPDAPSRAALLGIDLAELQRTSVRLYIATEAVFLLSALTVLVIGVLFFGIPLGNAMSVEAVGSFLLGVAPFFFLSLVPTLISIMASTALSAAVRPRLTPRSVIIVTSGIVFGLVALLSVVCTRLLLPLGGTEVLGFAAGIGLAASIPGLSIANLPSAFRRPNPKVATAIDALKALPVHLTALDGRVGPLVANQVAWQFLFIAIVPISAASAGAGVLAALVLTAVCLVTCYLDVRARPATSLAVSIAAAAVFLAAAIVSAR